jgi:hypothetical protein
MKAKITILGREDDEIYYVKCREDCRDDTDKSAYDEFVKSGGETITMGKVIVSKHPADFSPLYPPRWGIARY